MTELQLERDYIHKYICEHSDVTVKDIQSLVEKFQLSEIFILENILRDFWCSGFDTRSNAIKSNQVTSVKE